MINTGYYKVYIPKMGEVLKTKTKNTLESRRIIHEFYHNRDGICPGPMFFQKVDKKTYAETDLSGKLH